jgi:hypothetical protein
MPFFQFALHLFLLSLAGCAGLSERPVAGEAGIDGIACTGQAPVALAGLSAMNNEPLLAKAQHATGRGGVCSAKVFLVMEPLVVYRVYDAGKPGSALGSWWALARPAGPREDYRALNAICKEWSNLNQLISCQVKPGSEIVLGTTQSVDCADHTVYPKTAQVQVFVPNDQRAGLLHVENCREEGSWP